MGITRLGNAALYNTTMRDVSDVQRRLAELQEQISSGIKAKDFAGLNGQVERFTQLEARMRTAQQQMEGNQVNISRMKTADQALSQSIDIADAMENLIVTGRNGSTGKDFQFRQVMENYLGQLGGTLNINFEGRYLFGGTHTSTPPVPNPLQGPLVDGVPDDGYYAGSKQNIIYSQDERRQYEFPVRADDPAFQKIIAAAHKAIKEFERGNPDAMGEALSMIQEGQQELNTARERLNHTILNVEQTNESLGALSLYWKGVTEEVAKTDLVAASTEVANNEAILQAAFAVFSRLSQLRLTDYLR